MQINTEEFKNIAQGIKSEKIEKSSFVYRLQRSLSFFISQFLTKYFPEIKPNHISFLSIDLVLMSMVFILFMKHFDPYIIVFVQFLLLFMSSILDKVDGELARIQNRFSQQGIYLDVLYHIYYVLVFYFVVGYFFFEITGNQLILLLSLFLGFLMFSYKISGKIRHHIKYKIILEKHEDKIIDFGREKIRKKQPRPIRLFNYLVFMIYDWAFFFCAFIVLIAFFSLNLGAHIYIIYTAVATLLVLFELFFFYPRESLFTREDF